MIMIFLIVIGTLFVVIAGLGVLRLSDFYSRLHAASKAAPFGVTLLLIGVGVDAGTLDIAIRVVIIYTFLLATAPIAAHVIGRAAYLGGDRMELPCMDELEGKYDRQERKVHSSESLRGPEASTEDQKPDRV